MWGKYLGKYFYMEVFKSVENVNSRRSVIQTRYPWPRRLTWHSDNPTLALIPDQAHHALFSITVFPVTLRGNFSRKAGTTLPITPSVAAISSPFPVNSHFAGNLPHNESSSQQTTPTAKQTPQLTGQLGLSPQAFDLSNTNPSYSVNSEPQKSIFWRSYHFFIRPFSVAKFFGSLDLTPQTSPCHGYKKYDDSPSRFY